MVFTGITLLSIGLPLGFYAFDSWDKANNNPNYIYASNTAEFIVNAFLVASIIMVLAGITLIIVGCIKRRLAVASITLKNSTTNQFCQHCNVNVSTSNDECPICKNKLK